MGRFAAAGIESHAMSLRGTSGSPCPDGSRSVRIGQHVDDLSAFVEQELGGRPPPVLVGHSFGGSSVLKYLEAGGAASGVALVCSVPPSGNSKMTLRFIGRSLRQAWLITRGFAMKTAASDPADARALFFDEKTADDELAAYMPRLAADSQVGLDLGDFNRNLPSRDADERGEAAWLARASPPLPVLVIGAERDAVVDAEGVKETAAFLGTEATVLAGLPHDVMLCRGWEVGADRIIDWMPARAR